MRCVPSTLSSCIWLPTATTDDSFARILPVLALLFLCSFLDRTNVGNAKIIGLEADLGITDLQYNSGLAVFYAFYIARQDITWLILNGSSS
jgi:hypothetical protein